MASETFNLNLLITVTEKGAESVTQGINQKLLATGDKAALAGQETGTKFSQGIAGGALSGIAALGAAVAGLRLIQFGKSAIEDTIQFSRANEELAAQIQATGDISGASVPQIDRLAGSIEKTQAIYSGTAKQGAALLLTFQEVRNEAGKGNDIFNRTLNVAAAVSNVFGKDITSSVLQVGRALENPQAGIQALSRSGLTLEKGDRQRILNLAAQNDLLGAQRALLDALESRTLAAGQAAAKADPLQQFGVEFEKFKVQIGKDIIPEAKGLLELIKLLTGGFTALPGPIRGVTETLLAFGVAALALQKVSGFFGAFKTIAATGAKQAAADAELQAEATGKAAAATDALTVEQGKLAVSVKATLTPVTELGGGLATLGEGGATGISTVIGQLGALSEALAGTVEEVAGLRGALATLGTGGGAGLTTIEEQLAALDDQIAGTEGVVAGLEETLATLGAGGVSLNIVGEQFAKLDTQITAAEAKLAELKGQLATLGTGGVGLAGADEEFAVLNAVIAETQSKIAALKVQLADLSVSSASALGGEFAVLEGQIDGTAESVLRLKTELSTLGVSGAAVTGEEFTALDAQIAETELEIASLEEQLATLGASAEAGSVEAQAALTGLQSTLAETITEVGILKAQLGTLGAAGAAGAGEAAVGAAGAGVAGEAAAGAGAAAAGGGTAAAGLLGVEGLTLGTGLGVATAGIVSFSVAYQGLNALVGGHHTPFKQLSDDTDRAAQDIKDMSSQGTLEHLTSGFNKTLQQDKTDIADLNSGFKSLADSDGAPAAEQAIGGFIGKLQAAGVPMEKIGALLKPALDYINQLAVAENKAAGATDDMVTALDKLAPALDKRDSILGLADAFDTLSEAQKKVAQDKADISSHKAERDAARAVADANQGLQDANQQLSDSYAHLQDAQDSVTTSAHSLAEAQQALNDFNSPRGAEERALQLDIINRRVISTPSDADQKQLDLMKFEDDNRNKQTQLQDALTNAQKGYRDALNSVADAHNGIAKAQKGVADATDKVTEAVNKQKTAAADAYAQLHTDQHKAEEDGNKIAEAIQGIVDKYPELATAMEPYLAKLLLSGVLSKDVANSVKDILTNQQKLDAALKTPQGPEGPKGPPQSGSSGGSSTIEDYLKALLPHIKLPFAEGGITENHTAQIAGAGTRVWAEPETGGEAYIPLASSKRGRSTEILSAVAERFGLHLADTKSDKIQHYADGGMVDDQMVQHYVTGGVTGPDQAERYADGGITGGVTGPSSSPGPRPADDPRSRLPVAAPAPLPSANVASSFTDDIARISAVILAADQRLHADVQTVTQLTTQIPAEAQNLTDDRATLARLTVEVPAERSQLDRDRDLLHALQALGSFGGIVEPGNIDVTHRAVAQNADGSISTVRSITIGVDGGHAALIPTVIGGAVVSNQEAIQHYHETNQHLGIFVSEAVANDYAQLLHNEQAIQYGPTSSIVNTENFPHFDKGGIVPGAPGAPQLAVVHGGERVLTPEQQAAAHLDTPKVTLQAAPAAEQKVSGAAAPALPASATATAQGGAAGAPGAAGASATAAAASVDRVLSSVSKISEAVEKSSTTDRSTDSTSSATTIDRALSTIERNATASSASTSALDRVLSSVEKTSERSDQRSDSTTATASSIERSTSTDSTTSSAVERVLASVEKNNERSDSTTASEKATASSIERVLSSVQAVSTDRAASSDSTTSSAVERVLASVEKNSERSESTVATDKASILSSIQAATSTASDTQRSAIERIVSSAVEKQHATNTVAAGAPGASVSTSAIERVLSSVEKSDSRTETAAKTQRTAVEQAAAPIQRVLSLVQTLTSKVNAPAITLPHFDDGGIVPGLPGVPRIIVAHGGERVQTTAQQRSGDSPLSVQEVHFHGSETPTLAELDYLNRENGWRLSRSGRS